MTNRPIPQLDTLQQQAKSLLKVINAGSKEALTRTEPYFSDSSSLSLQNVQLVVAREYGFESWSKLKSHIFQVTEELGDQDDAGAMATREVARQFQGSTEYLRNLFDVQTPELTDGRIRILSAARVPGVRAKIAVKALDSSIDPVCGSWRCKRTCHAGSAPLSHREKWGKRRPGQRAVLLSDRHTDYRLTAH